MALTRNETINFNETYSNETHGDSITKQIAVTNKAYYELLLYRLFGLTTSGTGLYTLTRMMMNFPVLLLSGVVICVANREVPGYVIDRAKEALNFVRSLEQEKLHAYQRELKYLVDICKWCPKGNGVNITNDKTYLNLLETVASYVPTLQGVVTLDIESEADRQNISTAYQAILASKPDSTKISLRTKKNWQQEADKFYLTREPDTSFAHFYKTIKGATQIYFFGQASTSEVQQSTQQEQNFVSKIATSIKNRFS